MNDYMFSNGVAKTFMICKCGGHMSAMLTPNPLAPAHSCARCGNVYSPLIDSYAAALSMLTKVAGPPPGMVMMTNRGLVIGEPNNKEVEK